MRNKYLNTFTSFARFTKIAGVLAFFLLGTSQGFAQCDTPDGLSATPGVAGNGYVNVTLNWNAPAGADHYLVKYRVQGVTTWQLERTNTNSIQLDPLVALTNYEWIVRTFCDVDETIQSDFSTIQTFTTIAGLSCEIPSGLSATPGVSGGGFVNSTFNWTAAAGADHYLLKYRQIGTTVWEIARPSSNSFVAEPLTANADYEWIVKTYCNAAETVETPFSDVATFTTLNGFSCEIPTNLVSTPGLDGNGFVNVQLDWDAADGVDHYLVRYKEVGATKWELERPSTNSITLDVLVANTDYEWMVKTYCDAAETVESAFSTIESFTTLNGASCGIPGGLSSSVVLPGDGTLDVTLSWNAASGADHYLVRYREVGTAPWTSSRPGGTSLVVEDLMINTTYEWSVRTFCNADETIFSNFAALQNFSSCLTPENLSATPGVGGSGFVNAMLSWTTAAAVDHFEVRYRTQGSTEWERMEPSTNSLELNALLANTTYEWTVRAFCNASETNKSNFANIETFTTGAGMSCGPATMLVAVPGIDGSGFNNAMLTWTASAGADHYSVKFRPAGTSDWQLIKTSSNSLTVGPLLANTTYDWLVSTFCDAAETIRAPFSDIEQFTTLMGSSCGTPTNLAATPASDNAMVSWNAAAGVDHYLLKYREVGTNNWKVLRPATNSATITGLSASTDYQWTVRTYCDAAETVQSPYADFQTFTTTVMTSNFESVAINSKAAPNPAKRFTSVSFTAPVSGKATVQLFNASGLPIGSSKTVTVNQADLHAVDFNIDRLAEGIYFYRLGFANGKSEMGRIIISR